MSITHGFRGATGAEPRTNPHVTTVLLLLVLVSTATAQYSGGTGEPNDPYQIATADDLISLGETPADYDKHFILTADIDLDPNLPWGKVFDHAVIAPTADRAEPNSVFEGTAFSGVFDGNTHTVSNLTVRGVNYLGLFGRTSGSVRNLCLDDVAISGSGYYAGGVAGYNAGVVSRCSSIGVLQGRTHVGGLIGYNAGTVI
jgi:hypothetical protein